MYFASLFQVCERIENVSEGCVRDFERFVISTVDTRNSSDVSSEGEEERGRESKLPPICKVSDTAKSERGGVNASLGEKGRGGGERTLLCHLVWVGYSLSSWRVLIDRYDPFQDERESGVTIQ